MENYNLTAELKKIASGITSTDPNTELGNINSGVGNLDTAMQGVATAINGLSIPNPGSNIDGVATAINNKTIPDNTSNITAVANAIVSMAGGKDLDDLIAILTNMNGNIANLGSNHITNILEAPGTTTGYQLYYGNGDIIPLPNAANKTSYTDTNNIGVSDTQGAIDYILVNSKWKYLGAVTGTNHLSHPAIWQEMWIQCVGPDTTWQNYDFTILKEFIDNPNRPTHSAFRNGFYVSNSDYAECTIVTNASEIYINSLRVNGNNVTANSVMRVYFR